MRAGERRLAPDASMSNQLVGAAPRGSADVDSLAEGVCRVFIGRVRAEKGPKPPKVREII